MNLPPNVSLVCLIAALWAILPGLGRGLAAEVDFNREIRPLLAAKCFHCHGPDAKSRKADLRLDTREGVSTVIEAGDSENSELTFRIFETDPDEIMPPPDFHEKLSEEEKALIAEWIDAGAKWEEHWSFQPIKPAKLLAAKNDWGRNLIDQYIREGHQPNMLHPNPEADRYTLARRAALDIIGLPPTRSELDAFLNDEEPDAYERYIDRLLDSKHYGEHRARFWLDAARYSDTHGLHFDNFREMWLYRDWVINAFNQNQPFDQFTIEQLAGDLLKNPTREQLIATGFLRNNPTSAEGGSIPEELWVRYINDRTSTVSTVFLGLSANCASCHDHKFDPISQKEFYEMAAFFNNSTDPAIDGNMRDTYPVVVVPDHDTEPMWNVLQERRENFYESIATPPLSEIENWWNNSETTDLLDTHPVVDDSLEIHAPFDELKNGETPIWIKGDPLILPAPGAVPASDHPEGNRGFRFEKTGGIKVPVKTFVQPDSPVTVTMWMRTPDNVKMLDLLKQHGAADEEKDLKLTGWNIEIIPDGAFEMPFRDETGAQANALMPSETALKPNSWQQIALRYSGGQAASSLSYFVNGEWRVERRNNDTHLTERFGDHLPDEIIIAGDAVGGGISDLRIFSRWLLDEEIKLISDEFRWKKLVSKKPAWNELAPEDRELVIRYYQFKIDRKTMAEALEIGRDKTRIDYLYARSPTTLVMGERKTPARAEVLHRGEYDKPGETVFANTPAVLPPLNAEPGTANRLDLAKWLVANNHPLLARVTVNRIWQSLFGTGLVKTSDDFGIMGEKPSHPELLDYLAGEFIRSGWDIKALIRRIVTSSTYRQDSTIDAWERSVDPGNRYLARGPRRRLDAEVIRDQAIAVTGALDRKTGGPSVKPYQPAGLWKVVALQGSNTGEFKQDNVENLHRRSLYTFWKRTSIHPAFAAFDAPTRESCTVRRERTNTPLQALVLLNDVQYIEASRVLAESLLKKYDGLTATELAGEAYLSVVGRPMKGGDGGDIVLLAAVTRKHFLDHPKEAEKLVTVGELPADESLDPVDVATWTMVINTLLNRDDVISQH